MAKSIYLLPPKGMFINSKSINRKDHKGFTQRSQRFQYQCFAFVCFAQYLARFAVKKTFSTAPWGHNPPQGGFFIFI
jgi:hypothetical protein